MEVNFVPQRVDFLGMAPTSFEPMIKLIELAGRTAYKSEDKITEDSAKRFVRALHLSGHLSVLEHSNICFCGNGWDARDLMCDLKTRMGFHPITVTANRYVLAGNIRAWIDSLAYLQEEGSAFYHTLASFLNLAYPDFFHDDPEEDFFLDLIDEDNQLAMLQKNPKADFPVFTFRITTDRGITHEIVRHRVLSFTQESTRYVNYGNKGVTFMLPEFLEPYYTDGRIRMIEKMFKDQDEIDTRRVSADQRATLEKNNIYHHLARVYQNDVASGTAPQIARDVLPNLLKAEIVVSGRWSGWKHFINLRKVKGAHPRIQKIAKDIEAVFADRFGLVA